MIYLLKGMLIGLLFGIPVGAVGTLTVHRTFRHGVKAGLVTGLGASAADCFYASVGAFGITIVSDILLRHQTIITFCGGGIILFMGIQLLLKKGKMMDGQKEQCEFVNMFLSSFAIGITNPTAILTFLFAFTYFQISGEVSLCQGICLVFGVFLGTYFWWGCLSEVCGVIKKKRILSVFSS